MWVCVYIHKYEYTYNMYTHVERIHAYVHIICIYICMYIQRSPLPHSEIYIYTCPGQDVPRSLAILWAVCRFTLLRDFVAARRLVLAHDLVVAQLQRPLGLYQVCFSVSGVFFCIRSVFAGARECVYMCVCAFLCVFVSTCMVGCVFAHRPCGCIVKCVRGGVSVSVCQRTRVFSCGSYSSITS